MSHLGKDFLDMIGIFKFRTRRCRSWIHSDVFYALETPSRKFNNKTFPREVRLAISSIIKSSGYDTLD